MRLESSAAARPATLSLVSSPACRKRHPAFATWHESYRNSKRITAAQKTAAAAEVLEAWELDQDRRIPLDPRKSNDADQILFAQWRIEQSTHRVRALSPAAAAMFACLGEAMAEHVADVVRRLEAQRSHVLIVARCPSRHWYQAAQEALGAWLAMHTAVVGSGGGDLALCTPRDVARGRPRSFDLIVVSRFVRESHVVAVHELGVDVPDELAVLADVVVDLSALPTAQALGAVVADAFGGGRFEWPTSIEAADFQPDWFDMALERGTDGVDVVGVVHAMRLLHEETETRIAENADRDRAKLRPEAVPILRPTAPVLGDLAGYGAARAWGESLALDLADYRAGRIGWSDVDTGCLLSGPPGTGKTLFASALAATCGVAFVPTSFSEWSGAKGWGLDDVISGIRRTLAAAAQAAPCILFIDEIDAIPARGGDKRADSYWAPVVTALLEGLDGTARREGVVAVAACNNPDRLDPALVRSGRLDRRFEIGLPDEAALVGILGHHLPGIVADVLVPVATTLAGTASGADVARIAREARRTARRAGRTLEAGDLLAVAMPADTRPVEVQRRIAVHEAGHAVALLAQGRVPDVLTLVAAEGSGARVVADRSAGLHLLGDVEAEVVVLLAGRAAEEIVLGQPSVGAGGGRGSDLERTTQLLAASQSVLGLGGYLVHGLSADAGIVEERLRRLYAETLLLVGRHRTAVERLADLALERRVLGRQALATFAAEHGFGGAL